MKKITKSYLSKTINLFKQSAGIKSYHYSKENIDKMDEWFTHSNSASFYAGIEGQLFSQIISDFSSFANTYGTFSAKQFIDQCGDKTIQNCYRVLVRDGYKDYAKLLK